MTPPALHHLPPQHQYSIQYRKILSCTAPGTKRIDENHLDAPRFPEKNRTAWFPWHGSKKQLKHSQAFYTPTGTLFTPKRKPHPQPGGRYHLVDHPPERGLCRDQRKPAVQRSNPRDPEPQAQAAASFIFTSVVRAVYQHPVAKWTILIYKQIYRLMNKQINKCL